MSAKALKLLFIAVLALAVASYPYESTCDCPDTLPIFPGVSSWDPSRIQTVSLKDEVINNENWGRIIFVGNQAWLSKEATPSPSVDYLIHNCPAGWRAPTEVELLTLLNEAARVSPDGNAATLFATNKFNIYLSDAFAYLSSDETYPDQDNEAINESWEFKALTITSQSGAKSAAVSSVSSRQSNVRVKCISNTTIEAPSPAAKILHTPENEIIEGVDNGKLVYFAGRLWLSSDLSATRAYRTIGHTCPKGFRPPTMDELTQLANAAKLAAPANPAEFLTKQLGYNPTLNYVSSTKTYPDNTVCNTKEAWEFYVLSLKGTTVNVGSIVTYWYPDNLAARCVLDERQDFVIAGAQNKELVVGRNYEFKVSRSNIASVFWSDGPKVIGEITDSSFQNVYQFVPKTAGCNVINVYVELFGGIVMNKCLFQWAQHQPSVAGASDLARNVNKISLGANVKRATVVNSQPGSAPLAAKVLGGSYVLYSDSASESLKVKELREDGSLIRDIDLGEKGLPLDISEVPFGFVALLKNQDRLSLVGINEDGTRRFTTNLINNGPKPVNGTDQLKFYGRADGTLIYGMNAMFNPTSGRLIFARGRINVHFSHFNFFGYYQDGTTRSDHNGDSFVTFNLEGRNEMIGWSWGTTTSLTQSITFDGERVVTANLGASNPMTIKVNSVNPQEVLQWVDPFTRLPNKLVAKSSDKVVEGEIPFNAWYGGSCGRLGGIRAFEKVTALVYSRKKCDLVLWKKFTNLVEELAVVLLGADLNVVKKVVIVENQIVNQVKTARYGKNLIVGYSITKNDIPLANTLPEGPRAGDEFFLAIVNDEGVLVQNGVKINDFSLSTSDEWVTLSNGTVAWTYVDDKGNLFYNSVAN